MQSGRSSSAWFPRLHQRRSGVLHEGDYPRPSPLAPSFICHADTMTANSNTHFDTAARDWDQRPMSQQLAAVPPRLLAQVPFAASDHVLDFGAGTGLLSSAIAPRVAQVTALDMSAAMLQVLDEKGFANALHPGGQIALVDLYQEDGSFHGDNTAKGVQHFGFAPEALQALARQAGFTDIVFTEILRMQHRNGRAYPLFLMTGHMV